MIALIVWVMVGIALWHFAVLVPDRFLGGIIGAFLAAVAGAFLLPTPGVPPGNPPGMVEGIFAIPGSLLFLVAAYRIGARRDP